MDQKIEKKKKWMILIGSIIVVFMITMIALYIANSNVRTFLDRYVLQKEITENDANCIDLSEQEEASIYAFDSYITLLHKNQLSLYDASAKKQASLEVNISQPLYASDQRFLMIAQKEGQQLYCISDGHIQWQKEVEGQIQKININENGYGSVIVTGGSYKTTVITYNPQGKELFKTYLSSTIALDTSISKDNQYLAIAEVNTSGTLVQSSMKIVSIEKAQNDPIHSVVGTHVIEPGILIKNVQYQDRNCLVSMYDDQIRALQGEQDQQMISFLQDRITFASIRLEDYFVYVTEKSTGLFNTNMQVSFKHPITQKENIYVVQGTLKDMKANASHVALNLGSQIHFVSTNGWLSKKYTSETEVKEIVLGRNIAGVVYKDKIDVIRL